jgi:hypothetical protein
MAASVNQRVNKRREILRAAGLRPVQIWVPDTRLQGFAEECRRQSLVAAEADRKDTDMKQFLDAILDDMDLPPYEEK